MDKELTENVQDVLPGCPNQGLGGFSCAVDHLLGIHSGLLGRVCPHVSCQMRGVKVAFPAGVAQVGFLPSVRSPDVHRQVSTEAEVLPAGLAGKRPLASVNSHVYVHLGRFDEAFATKLTLIWLFTCVSSHVHIQARHFDECFPADFAQVRLLTCVGSNMDFEFRHINECFATGLAQVWPLTCVVPSNMNF